MVQLPRRKMVVYVAGPYRADTEFQVEENIKAARYLALEVWKRGMVAICPHLNTYRFGGAPAQTGEPLHVDVWLQGDFELVRRSDALLLVSGWQRSEGSVAEVDLAKELGLPVFETLSQLETWAHGSKGALPMPLVREEDAANV